MKRFLWIIFIPQIIFSGWLDMLKERPLPIGVVEAPAGWQCLWKEAQKDVGIEEYWMGPLYVDKNLEIKGIAYVRDGIGFLNKKGTLHDLDCQSYGVKRFTLYHEAVHIKRSHYSAFRGDRYLKSLYILLTCGFNLACLGLEKIDFCKVDKWDYIAHKIYQNYFFFIFYFAFLNDKIARYLHVDIKRERIADQDAALKCSCCECVREMSEYYGSAFKDQITLQSGGYLSSDDLNRLAKTTLKGKFCKYHQTKVQGKIIEDPLEKIS